MEQIYAAMLLHKAGKPVTEANLKGVLQAAGASADESQLKATVAALNGVDIDKVIKEALLVSAAPAGAAPAGGAKAEAKPAEEEKKVSEEEAAAGLGALFG